MFVVQCCGCNNPTCGCAAQVKALLVSAAASEKFTLVPYAVTPNFQRWASQLSEFGVSVFGESLEWIKQYGHELSSAPSQCLWNHYMST